MPVIDCDSNTRSLNRQFLCADCFCRDDHHAAITVQDYPLPGLDETKHYYFNDSKAFVNATKAAGLPAAVCCTLPENLDKDTRDYLVGVGVTPAQGIHEALNAIAGAVWYGKRRGEILKTPNPLSLIGRGGAQRLVS